MTPGGVLQISPQVAWVDRGGRIWLLDLAAREPMPISLTGSGAELWRLLPASLDGLLAAAQAAYGEGVSGDVSAFVDSLLSTGILVPAEAG